MGISEQLMFSDVQRMDKRQVFLFSCCCKFNIIANLKFLNDLPSNKQTMYDWNMFPFQFLYQVLSFGMIVSSALMIWKGLMVVTGSESPIVVVLSGSMEPAFHRGDLLFLTNYREEPVRVGEIVVFKVQGRDIPIVHRVIKLHEK